MTTPSTTPAVEATGLWKRFGERFVVRDVSLSVSRGELLGFVGPNGSGKTTTIRMLLDIIRPNEGSVALFGGPMTDEAQALIGYLPEERGLYQSQRVLPSLIYLAELKGMETGTAKARAEGLLERLGMAEHSGKRVRELSRGMTQLIQFGATIIHKPAFLVLDEPFSGLDPINARLMKEIIAELAEDGAAIMFSTHQMTDVEELCNKVVMIHQGEVVLDGPLDEIKRRHADNSVYVETASDLTAIGLGADVRRQGSGYTVRLDGTGGSESLLRQLLDAGANIDRYEPATPTLEEIFLKTVGERRG